MKKFVAAKFFIILLSSLMLFIVSDTSKIFACGTTAQCTQGYTQSSPNNNSDSCSSGGGSFCTCHPWACGQSGGSSGPPPCNDSDPNTPSLRFPTNGAIVDNTNFTSLGWNGIGDWGNNCGGNSNGYQLGIGLCGQGFVESNYGTNISSTLIRDVVDGAGEYCWYVKATNGARTRQSSTWRFSLQESALINSNLGGDVCGYGITGRQSVNSFNPTTNDPSISNPIDLLVTHRYELNRTPRYISLAIGPRDQNTGSISSSTPREADFARAISNNGTVVVRFDIANNQLEYLEGNSSGTINWVSTTGTTVDLNTTQILGVGIHTFVNHDSINSTVTANFRIYIKDNFPEGRHYVYSNLLVEDSNGIYQQAYGRNSNGEILRRVGAFISEDVPTGGNLNWAVDLTDPLIRFPNGIRLVEESITQAGIVLIDYEIIDEHPGNIVNASPAINNIQSVDSFIFKLDSTEDIQLIQTDPTTRNVFSLEIEPQDYSGATGVVGGHQFDPLNGIQSNVTESIPSSIYSGFVRYQNINTVDLGKRSNIGFKMQAQDLACNFGDNRTTRIRPRVWPMFIGGVVSYNDNISNINIPVLDLLDTNALDLSGVDIFYRGIETISTELLLQKELVLPLPVDRVSADNMYTTDYTDNAFNLSEESASYGSWYNKFSQILIDQSGTIPVKDNPVDTTINSNVISSLVDVRLDVPHIILVQGDLTITGDSTCDSKYLILVENNLFIERLARDPLAACLFIVGGDIEVLSTGIEMPVFPATGEPVLELTNSEVVPYDVIEAFLITDGEFSTNVDNTIPSGVNAVQELIKWQGVHVKGGVVAENIFLGRDMNDEANQFQPPFLIEFDPRYTEVFRSQLSGTFIQLREE